MKAKKRVSLIATLAALAAAGYGAYSYFTRPPKLTFLKAQVTRGSIESVISATGTLAATRSVAVGSRVSGNVVRMYADYNTPVRKGQLIAEIDPSTFEAALEQRRASLRAAETQRLQAQVAERRADVDVRNAETNVISQRAAVARAKSQADEAKRKWEIQKGLAENGIASRDSVETAKATYDQALLSLETAEAQLRQAEANLEAAKAQREVALTQKVSAEAQITQATAAVQDAELQLSFTRITAPVDGIVIERNMDEGQTVQASMSAPQLYKIAEDLSSMHLETNIDESDIARVQVGQQATFTVDAFPGQVFRGEVIQVRRAAVNVQNVISYTVVISVDNSDLRLFPGMTANTRIIAERVADTLRVPTSALRFRPPPELKVVGDLPGKGKGAKDGAKGTVTEVTKEATKEVSKAAETSRTEPVAARPEPLKQAAPQTVAQVAPGQAATGQPGEGRRGRRGGDGNFDPSQFQGREGFDPSQFKGRGGFDPSQFKGRGGGEGPEVGQFPGRGGRGGFDPSQFQGKGGGGFDPSQFSGKSGGFDREALRAQFQAKGLDPSLLQGRAGGGRGGRGGAGGFSVQQTQTVYRLNANNEVEAVRIRTGISDGTWVQLLSNNLKEGDELITAVEGLPTATKQTTAPGFPGGPGGNFKGGRGGFPF
jgi:HlyD family secretion protein